jgi:hypothetical protein
MKMSSAPCIKKWLSYKENKEMKKWLVEIINTSELETILYMSQDVIERYFKYFTVMSLKDADIFGNPFP